MNSPWAPPPRTRPTGPPTTPGIWRACRAARAAAAPAAVAGRLVPAALGTDTGGSVRQPASFCGVTGIKPTYGRVSRYGLVAYGSSLDSVGAFARSAADVALLFSQHGRSRSARRHLDGRARARNPARRDPALRGLRIGVPRGILHRRASSPRSKQAVRAGDRPVLEALGASVRPISLPHTEYALPVYYLIAPAEASRQPGPLRRRALWAARAGRSDVG